MTNGLASSLSPLLPYRYLGVTGESLGDDKPRQGLCDGPSLVPYLRR